MCGKFAARNPQDRCLRLGMHSQVHHRFQCHPAAHNSKSWQTLNCVHAHAGRDPRLRMHSQIPPRCRCRESGSSLKSWQTFDWIQPLRIIITPATVLYQRPFARWRRRRDHHHDLFAVSQRWSQERYRFAKTNALYIAIFRSRRPSVSWIFAPKTFCLTNQLFGLGATNSFGLGAPSF